MRRLHRTPFARLEHGAFPASLLLALLLQLALPGIHGAALGAVSRPPAPAAHAAVRPSEAEIHAVAQAKGHDADTCPQCQAIAHARCGAASAAPRLARVGVRVPLAASGSLVPTALGRGRSEPRAPPAPSLPSA